MQFFRLNTMPLVDSDFCIIGSPVDNADEFDFKLSLGISALADQEEEIGLHMSDMLPESIQIPSLVANTLSYFIASSQVKHIISSLNVDPIEYFPVVIYNHKRRVASRDYFIINPIGAFDCLELEASTITWVEGEAAVIDEYVLDPNKIKKAPDLFRIPEEPSTYVMSGLLVKALAEAKPALTNVFLHSMKIHT